MGNAIAFLVLSVAMLAAFTRMGMNLGASRERQRMLDIAADHHARHVREESLKPKPATEYDMLMAVFRRIPCGTTYTGSVFGGPAVTVSGKSSPPSVLFEFDQAGSLRHVQALK